MEETFGKRWNAAIYETRDWAQKPKLERATGSALHRFTEAFQRNDLLYYPSHDKSEARAYFAQGFDHEFQIFVVEHDWASAFQNAAISGDVDSESDDFRLPFPECCFEFQISGRRLCVSVRVPIEAQYQQYRHVFAAVLETSQGWMALPLEGSHYDSILPLIKAQIRSVCIALDAEIAETDVVRAPHKLNIARDKRGKPPLFDYRTVNLARRRRIAALPSVSSPDSSEKRGVRLHFRRGHWRHYETHKTWIKWTLVGDPDLGFIEKHYRL